MAKPIKDTPILKGKDAKKFIAQHGAENVNFFSRIINNYLANKQAKRIIKGLNEAEKIHAKRCAEKNLKERQRVLNCPLLNKYNL